MDELITTVSQRTGISADQARTAVQTVIDHLRSVLPEPLAGQLESFVGGGGQGQGGLGGMLGSVSGMLGGQPQAQGQTTSGQSAASSQPGPSNQQDRQGR
jgi:hypothetical protein